VINKTDPILQQIAAEFSEFDVEQSRVGYNLLNRRNASAVARLRPIPNTDRFELFYWCNHRDRWRSFGNLGRLKLMLQSARKIVDADPIFRIPRR
jgi:hypothetical protein